MSALGLADVPTADLLAEIDRRVASAEDEQPADRQRKVAAALYLAAEAPDVLAEAIAVVEARIVKAAEMEWFVRWEGWAAARGLFPALDLYKAALDSDRKPTAAAEDALVVLLRLAVEDTTPKLRRAAFGYAFALLTQIQSEARRRAKSMNAAVVMRPEWQTISRLIHTYPADTVISARRELIRNGTATAADFE